MDKNTIWAIVLSTLVIIGWGITSIIIQGKNNPVDEQVAVEQTVEESEQQNEAELSDLGTYLNENAAEIIAEEESPAVEETIKLDIGVATVEFSTKGGDIINYQLSEKHIDTDTNKGVQMVDNVTDVNRACALALGTADNKIINDIFSYERINENTLLFKKNFTVINKDGKEVKFTLGKRYTFIPGEYMFKLEVLIHSLNGTGLDLEGAAYTLRTSPQIGPHYDPKQNRYENRQFLAYNGKKTKKIILGSNQFKRYEKDLLWGGIAGKYFEELVIPTDASILNAGFYSSKIETNDYANAQALFERKAITTSDVQDTYYMYFGPRNEADLKIYNSADKNGWNFSGYRITESLQTSGFLSWLEAILKWALELLHRFIKNWGVCIIVLTIILKVLMFPLSKKQSLGTLKMQALQPKIQALQTKYADDQQKMQMEMQKIYQEAGYNPASGCLPMIFQFLILFAMYNLFNNYFEFRGAEFIKNWIPDLSVGDSVYKFSKSIPLLGNQIRILPVVYVITQLLFGKITQYGGAAGGNQNSATMKFMQYGMPIMFFFLFYNAPSGLLIYWITSNIFQMIQQVVINKMMQAKKEEMALPEEPKNKVLPPKAKAQNKKRK